MSCPARFGRLYIYIDMVILTRLLGNTSNVESVERWKQGGFYDKDYVHWYIATQTIKGE